MCRDINSAFNKKVLKQEIVNIIFLEESFRSLSFQYRIGERTVSSIVDETCRALYAAMKQQYLKVGFYYVFTLKNKHPE